MSLYIDQDEFSTEKAKRLGSLGKTDVTRTEVGSILSSQKMDDEYEKHNVTFEKEIDRLVVKGRFKRENEVEVVLYQNLRSNVYQVRVSKKPYTALCVDIFTEEETENGIEVTKYINAEGLSGKYSIYLRIDGVLYDTDQYVEF